MLNVFGFFCESSLFVLESSLPAADDKDCFLMAVANGDVEMNLTAHTDTAHQCSQQYINCKRTLSWMESEG